MLGLLRAHLVALIEFDSALFDIALLFVAVLAIILHHAPRLVELGPVEEVVWTNIVVQQDFDQQVLQSRVVRRFRELVLQDFLRERPQSTCLLDAQFMVVECLLDLADFLEKLGVVRPQVLQPVQVAANEKC